MTRALILAAGLVGLAGLGWAWWPRPNPQPASSPAPSAELRYTATGQVLGVKALGSAGCQVRVKLHQWLNISEGFGLAEIPQKGQVYLIGASPDQCLAVEVALAAQGDPDDLESPRHINYTAQQTGGGPWRLTQNPTAPTGCSGL